MNGEYLFHHQVTVKFHDDFGLPYRQGAEHRLTGEHREVWESIKEDFPDITLRPLLDSVTEERIKVLVGQAEDLDPTYTPPDFLAYFMIILSPSRDPGFLVQRLQEWKAVKHAFVQSPPKDSPHDCPDTSPCWDTQFFLDPPTPLTAPLLGGINAEFAWTQPGGMGNGISFVDVERGWKLNHVDLVDPTHTPVVTEIHGSNHDQKDHGTSVIGILVAQQHCRDCHGIAPEAVGMVSSIWTAPPVWNRPAAIFAAIDRLAFGDVLLLETQVEIGGVYLPTEFELDSFDAIRLATALGIIVVEAAGNNDGVGDWNLADFADDEGNNIFDPVDANRKDSGAIVVAAANPDNPPLKKSTSNYGERVDCFASGDLVKTLDVNFEDLDMDGIDEEIDAYTNTFSGTSSAAAIIAGAAILVQAVAEHDPAIGRFSPFQMRDILSDPVRGTTSTDLIGVMPDLGQIIPYYIDSEALSDVYIRDHVGDNGDPHTGSISASPDVIVQAGPATPAAFSGTATINSNTLGSIVTQGDDHFVYIRTLNRGAPANNVMADVYYTEPSSLQFPGGWEYIGSTPTGTLVPSDTTPLSITVLDPIPWLNGDLPPTGHYCFIATIYSDDDHNPLPPPANRDDLVLYDIDNFRRLIRENNNVTWRNFNVVPMTMDDASMELEFMAAGWPRKEVPMRLEIGARFPREAELRLTGPTRFMEKIIGNRRYFKQFEDKRVQIPLNPHGANRFLERPFPADLRARMHLTIDLPKEMRNRKFQIYARQIYKGKEVGRITWLLVPPVE